MFLDLVIEPEIHTTLPAETLPIPTPEGSPSLLIGCVIVVVAVTLIMLLVRTKYKKTK